MKCAVCGHTDPILLNSQVQTDPCLEGRLGRKTAKEWYSHEEIMHVWKFVMFATAYRRKGTKVMHRLRLEYRCRNCGFEWDAFLPPTAITDATCREDSF